MVFPPQTSSNTNQCAAIPHRRRAQSINTAIMGKSTLPRRTLSDPHPRSPFLRHNVVRCMCKRGRGPRHVGRIPPMLTAHVSQHLRRRSNSRRCPSGPSCKTTTTVDPGPMRSRRLSALSLFLPPLAHPATPATAAALSVPSAVSYLLAAVLESSRLSPRRARFPHYDLD